MIFKKEDWFSYGRWVQPPLSGCFWVDSSVTNSIKKFAPQFDFSPIIFLSGHTLGAVKDREAAKQWWADIFKDEQSTPQILKHWEMVFNETANAHLALESSRSEVENLFYTYQEMTGLWMMSILLADTLEEYLLANGYHQTDLMETVHKNLRPTWLQERTRELAYLSKQKDAPNFFDLVGAHVRKFSWYGTHHWAGEPYNTEKCLAELAELNPEVISKPSDVDLPAKFLESLTYWRTHCAEVTAKVVFSFRQVLTEVAADSNFSYEDLLLFSADEITNSLKTGQPLQFSPAIKERENGYGCYRDGENKIMVSGGELQNLLTILVSETADTASIIKGLVASKGSGSEVTGTVKIVISQVDFLDFKEGKILVSPETTPDFVPLMKKAKAIITDRGGITSHAAIVARELGKPCIIGTKNATQILQSGDEIKININLGTIEIVNKKSL